MDRTRVAHFMKHFDEIRGAGQDWSPERTEAVTHVPAPKLREMVTAYRTAEGAALYCSTGVNMGAHGSLAFWLQEAINAVSGNLDRSGGTLVGKGSSTSPRSASAPACCSAATRAHWRLQGRERRAARRRAGRRICARRPSGARCS
ncbi:MAG: hypothetical protein IPG17_21045 [Sandaracinaceae bacterium]|nr:hypothetical protein [Sandaracinaceae bacterium]